MKSKNSDPSIAEFDLVASNYEKEHAASILLSGESTDFFSEYKVADIRGIVSRTMQEPTTILDFGAGIGNSVSAFRRMFSDAAIICADVSEKSLEICRSRHGEAALTAQIAGGTLPLESDSVDIALAACVFHHIPEGQHDDTLRELRRVIRPGGSLFVFEHNPWNPLTRHAVSNCPFDENAVLISAPEMKRRIQAAGFKAAKTRYRIFFPHALAWLRPAEPLLGWLPAGAQYSIHGRV